jgi:hypothetical protein
MSAESNRPMALRSFTVGLSTRIFKRVTYVLLSGIVHEGKTMFIET